MERDLPDPLADNRRRLDNRLMKSVSRIFCTLFSLSFTGLCLAETPTRSTAGVDTLEQQVLQQLYRSHEWLEMQADNDRFNLLYRPAMTPDSPGALLILPDPGVAAGWLEQVRALTAYLPEHGWAVLAVEPPLLPETEPPRRTLPVMTGVRPGLPANDADSPDAPPPAATTPSGDNTTPAAAKDNGDTTNVTTAALPYPEQLQQRLELAWQELAQRNTGEHTIVLGIGRGAVWSAQLAINKGEDTGLILLDPLPDLQSKPSLTELLKPLEANSVIDLYHFPLPSYPDAEPDARQRRLQANKLGLSRYHQSRLPGVFRGWKPEMPWLVRQVRGLLERILIKEADAEKDGTSETESLSQTLPGQRPGG